jgi:hypothetical protein
LSLLEFAVDRATRVERNVLRGLEFARGLLSNRGSAQSPHADARGALGPKDGRL